MLVTEKQISNTILKLIRAGKRMPQADRLKVSNNTAKTAESILKETVELFAEIFIPQKISVAKWEKAEVIALTMSGNRGVDVNTISPALMTEALKAQQQIDFEESQRVNAQFKKDEEQGVVIDTSDFGGRKKKILWDWTSRKVNKRVPFKKYLPSDTEVRQKALDMGLTREQTDKNYKLIEICLSDEKYCAECQAECRFGSRQLPCYLDKKQKLMCLNKDGEIEYQYGTCGC